MSNIVTLNMSFYMSNRGMYTIDAIRQGFRMATTRVYPNEIRLIRSLKPGQPVKFVRTDKNKQVVDSIIVFALGLNPAYKVPKFLFSPSDLPAVKKAADIWLQLEGWDETFAKAFFKSNKDKEFWQFRYSLYPPQYKASPDLITELRDDEVFVFGSNIYGRHGAGAAKLALNFGAIYGKPEGLQGKTYALPTTDLVIPNGLTIKDVEGYVKKFIACAYAHPELIFLVTEVGCGLAGFEIKDIAPLFVEVLLKKMDNVRLPKYFLRYLVVRSIESVLNK